MTKPVTAIAVMILADEGKLSVDDPVEKHLPEFRGQMMLGYRQGDEIITLGGKNVGSISDLTSVLAPYHPNDKVDISWVDSSGNHHTANVTLSSAPPA